MVLGAFRGKLMEFMLQRFPEMDYIVGYEPQRWAAEEAQEHLSRYPMRRWQVKPYGLDTSLNGYPMQRLMGEWGTDGCSLVDMSRVHGHGDFMGIARELVDAEPWDLLIMNIEGYEWALLPYLLEVPPGGYIVRPLSDHIKALCVQFHTHGETRPTRTLLEAVEDEYGPPAYNDFPSWVYWNKL